MARSLLLLAPLLAVAGLALSGAQPASAEEIPLPATEQVLLGAPDPAAPAARGVFLSDPEGQIQHLVAVGHLVAWTVRTPTDSGDELSPTRPNTLPTGTRLVIVDERGGAPLTVTFPGRWVRDLRAFRGPSGPSDPRIAVRSCTKRKASSCKNEVVALTPDAPLALRSRKADRFSAAALAGQVDSGQQLVAAKLAGRGKHKACLPRLSVRRLSGGKGLSLPKLPGNADFPTCEGLQDSYLFGHFVFAVVARFNHDYGAPADFLYGIDLSGGKKARWRELRQPYSSDESSDYEEIGPGLTDDALYFEPVSSGDEGTDVWLAQVVLPRDVQRKRRKTDLVWSDPISSATEGGCMIAATDDAIYELKNPRCSEDGEGRAGEIRRIVNPEFKPSGGS